MNTHIGEKGKMIVLYGANNLGKSFQAETLSGRLQLSGISVKQIKYPIYDLEPTGSLLNAILREGLTYPEIEVQNIFVQNRRDYEPALLSFLDAGTWIVAEDYIGTGIAWGLVRGLDLPVLEEMNFGLTQADCSILLYGERFHTGKELNHRNEQDEELWNMAQEKHLFLAEKYAWQKVYATRPRSVVSDEIFMIVNHLSGHEREA